MEELIAGAKAVVAMGGYNTYCEILSFDKPALIVPRVKPRQEQPIRAERADELALITVLHDPSQIGEAERDPLVMAAALHALPRRTPAVPGLRAEPARWPAGDQPRARRQPLHADPRRRLRRRTRR